MVRVFTPSSGRYGIKKINISSDVLTKRYVKGRVFRTRLLNQEMLYIYFSSEFKRNHANNVGLKYLIYIFFFKWLKNRD